jgi:hypothetical protein
MAAQSAADGFSAELLFDAFVPRFTLRRRLRVHPDTFVDGRDKADVNVPNEKDAPAVNSKKKSESGLIRRGSHAWHQS